MTSTQTELRHMIADLVEGKEHWYLGEVTGATADSVTDPERMEPSNSLDGWYWFCYEGTAQGQERRIVSNDKATTTLNVVRPLNPIPVVGDKYEAHEIFTIREFRHAINQAVIEVEEEVLVPHYDESMVISSSTSEYAIPADFTHIFDPEVETMSGYWERIVPACWRINRGKGVLILDFSIFLGYSGCRLRINGFKSAIHVIDEADSTGIPDAYIIHKAAAVMASTRMRSRENDPRGWHDIYSIHEQQAQQHRADLKKDLPNNLRKVN